MDENDVKVLTTDDIIQALSENLVKLKDKEVLVASAKALAEVQKAKTDEISFEMKLENEADANRLKERELDIRELEVMNEKSKFDVDAKNKERELDIREREAENERVKTEVEKQKVEAIKKESRAKKIVAGIAAGGSIACVFLQGLFNSKNQQDYLTTTTELQDKGIIVNNKGLLPNPFQTKSK